MSMDFTCTTYRHLLEALLAAKYEFITFENYVTRPDRPARYIILRHDVEARYRNALNLALMQHDLQIKGTYYFRFLPAHFDTEIIRKIAALNHEIGYHYEDLSYCRGNDEKAIERFAKNLAVLREIAPVRTICMEGAPLSKYDNRDLWKKHHYRNYGIIGEPYFDTDFSDVLYLTDTGRRWDGEKVSVRDKVGGQRSAVGSRRNLERGTRNPELKFHSTADIIAAARDGHLPDRIMMTFHPQRWTDRPLPWLQELVMQNVKNVVKRVIVGR